MILCFYSFAGFNCWWGFCVVYRVLEEVSSSCHCHGKGGEAGEPHRVLPVAAWSKFRVCLFTTTVFLCCLMQKVRLLPFPVLSKELCFPWILLGFSHSSDPEGLLWQVPSCARATWSWLGFSKRWCWEVLVLCIYSCRTLSERTVRGKAVLMSWNANCSISYPIWQHSTELKYLLCS